jgi:eukaryotic-like serine/threonine-protein kinase
VERSVWITDFGLAKAEDDGLTATGDLLGTLRYMAPERFRSQGDARVDIYGLGLTFYELLTLRPAYGSADRLELVEQIKSREPPRPRSLDHRIPRDLETIVLKAIDKESARRYQTAEAMGEDLRRFLANEPIRARRISLAQRVWLWCRRNPVPAALSLLAATLATAIMVIATVAAFLLAHQRDEARVMATALGHEQTALRAERNKVRAAEGEAASARDEARRQLYVSTMRLAQQLWDSDRGNARAIDALLEQHVPTGPDGPDLRDFAWRLQWTRLHRASTPLFPPAPARSAVFEGRDTIAVLDDRGAVTRIDLQSGRIRPTIDFGRRTQPP